MNLPFSRSVVPPTSHRNEKSRYNSLHLFFTIIVKIRKTEKNLVCAILDTEEFVTLSTLTFKSGKKIVVKLDITQSVDTRY